MVICLERGADLHMAQLMPLPLTVSCFSKIQIGLPFLVPAHLGCSGKRAVKRVCICLWSRKCYISTHVGMARLRSTLSTVAHRSSMLSAGSVSGQPHSNLWWCHDIGYPLLDAEHSLCTIPWSGTPCQTTSVHGRIMSPLDRA